MTKKLLCSSSKAFEGFDKKLDTALFRIYEERK